MDNARINRDIKDLIESTGAKLLNNAPYSPDLNPIELMFESYKAALRRHNKEPWDRAHNYGLMSVPPDIARAFFVIAKSNNNARTSLPKRNWLKERKLTIFLAKHLSLAVQQHH